MCYLYSPNKPLKKIFGKFNNSFVIRNFYEYILSDEFTKFYNNLVSFEKQNYESLMNILEQYLYDEDKLKKLNEKANLYVKSFNWKNCAEKTLNLYKKYS